MDKYITIREIDNIECPNAGTLLVTLCDMNKKFRKAIESHFDAALVRFSFIHPEVESIEDCIDGMPIDILVTMDVDGFEREYKIELSETWLYTHV